MIVALPASAQVAGHDGTPPSIERAHADFEAGRYALAASEFEWAANANQADSAAYYWLGRARLEQGEYDRAIAAFARAVNLDSNNSEYYRWLGRGEGEVADREHSFSAARRVRPALERSVRLDPSSVAARRDLMGFYLEAPWLVGGSDSKARAQVEAIAALDPVAGHLARAAYFRHKKDADRARAEYEAVANAGPRDVRPYLEAAEFYERSSNAAGLQTVVDAMQKIERDEPQLLYFRGVLGALTGVGLEKAERALAAYLDRVPPRSDRPGPAATHEWLGRVYLALGQPGWAASEFRKALALQPDRDIARDRLRQLEQQKK
jgi:tetratricopeptide (TPR) repeat protein